MKRSLRYLSAFMLLTVILGHSVSAEDEATELTRDDFLNAAREIMDGAGFGALITIDGTGRPAARIMDPLPPDEAMVVRMGTNPKSRKVEQIRNDPRVALFYFDPEKLAYVTLLGDASLIDDPNEKAKRWKEDWDEHYSDREESFLLIEVSPRSLELSSGGHGFTGDPDTWTPDMIDLVEEEAASQPASSPYTGMGKREIKALSSERKLGLESGHGLGYAMAAELNHYPGPKHVLELDDKLDLTEEQRVATQTTFDEMLNEAKRLGHEIIAKERELDRLFAESRASDESLVRVVREAAALEADLRIAHLRAHLEMSEILDRHQVHLYDTARGYGRGMRHLPGHAH